MRTWIAALALAVPTAVAGTALTATPAVAGPLPVARTFTGVDLHQHLAAHEASEAMETWEQDHSEVCVERGPRRIVHRAGQWHVTIYAECTGRA